MAVPTQTPVSTSKNTVHPKFGKISNPTGWYRHYCLGLIFVVLVLNYVDRGILGVVIESIKVEFDLTDLQLGLLSGPAFAVFYAILGVPLARWADMGNRRIVVSLCLSIWSLMTALGGLAQNFTTLFLTRIGVGVGEAGAVPPTHSLVSSYYPPEHHGKAASVLAFSTFVGTFLGFAVGGYILAVTDWRTTLMAVGLPGVAVAVLAFFTLREPREKTRVPRPSEIFDAESRAIIKGLLKKKTYLQLLISFAIVSFFSFGVASFAVPFQIRSFGVDVDVIGRVFGFTAASSAVVGTLMAAMLVDRLAKKDLSWKLKLPAISCLIAVPFMVASLLAETYMLCMALYFVANSLISVAIPSLFAAVYGIILSSQRSMAIAVLGLMANLLGLGVGPVLIGAVSDMLTPAFGQEALRYTMAGCVFFLGWSAIHMLIGAKTFKDDYVGNEVIQPG